MARMGPVDETVMTAVEKNRRRVQCGKSAADGERAMC
jgi:hypothetical protein